MDSISINRTTYNYGYIVPLSSIPEERREQALTDFSEGSEALKKCLKIMWNIGLNTIGCRIGVSEKYEEGYITMEEGIDLFKYLSSNVLDDDMVRLWVITNTETSKNKQVLIFAGSKERKEETLSHLAEDLLTGIKNNEEQVKKKMGQPFSATYLIDKKEFELRKSNLSEEEMAYELWNYKQKLEAKEEKSDDVTIAV